MVWQWLFGHSVEWLCSWFAARPGPPVETGLRYISMRLDEITTDRRNPLGTMPCVGDDAFQGFHDVPKWSRPNAWWPHYRGRRDGSSKCRVSGTWLFVP